MSREYLHLTGSESIYPSAAHFFLNNAQPSYYALYAGLEKQSPPFLEIRTTKPTRIHGLMSMTREKYDAILGELDIPPTTAEYHPEQVVFIPPQKMLVTVEKAITQEGKAVRDHWRISNSVLEDRDTTTLTQAESIKDAFEMLAVPQISILMRPNVIYRINQPSLPK